MSRTSYTVSPATRTRLAVAGETIVNACKITKRSLDWGIELEPGTRDAGSDARTRAAFLRSP